MSQEIIRSYNNDMLIPTSFCFLIGLIYYYYKYRNTRNNIENNMNRSLNVNNNSQQDNSRNEINQNNFYPHFEINPEDVIKLFIMIKGNKINFDVSKNETVSNFIHTKLIQHSEIPYNERDRLKLIFQGRILDLNKKFIEYPNISNESVLHCYITNNSQRGNEYNNSRNEGDRINSDITNDENSVSIYTLLTHLTIFILVSILIFFYKLFSDIFTKGSLLVLKIMIVVWVIQVSKCLAKIAVYKKILYH